MTQIVRYENGIYISGHARYAKLGSDIVCAAISTLAQNLIFSIEELTQDQIKYDIQPALVDIKFKELSAEGKLLVDSFFIGAKNIAEQYPQYVQIA